MISFNLKCQRNGRVYQCRDRSVPNSNLGELMGCESDGRGRYWCCLQYCPDQKTIIYYKNYQIDSNVETATQRCTGTGANAKCLSNSNDICFKPIADYFPTNFEYCCPPDQGGDNTGNVNKGCYDKGTECPIRKFLCKHILYLALMNWQCPVTCDTCPPDGTENTRPPGIIDPPLPNKNCKDMLDCTTWIRNGYCTSSFYKQHSYQHCPVGCRVGCGAVG
uniref:ShKT domain-containing protein n=1 Tax=Meloidogyne floridensis TaxID=298350 RepID=A0A915PC05_9BILA